MSDAKDSRVPPNDDQRFARLPGLVLTQVKDHYLLWGRSPSARTALNPTAALIWLLCDGLTSTAGVRARLQEHYPDQAEAIARDVPETLADFQARRLITDSSEGEPSRPLLRVGFCNFWPGFDRGDNFFLWMLTRTFDVHLVNLPNEAPDLVFYSSFASDHFDHARVDRAQAFKVFVALHDTHATDTGCDYTISYQPDETISAHRQCRLPLWSLHVDWDQHERIDAALGTHTIPQEYSPRHVCDRLIEALFESEEKEGTIPDLASPSHPSNAALRSQVREHPSLKTGSRKLTIGMATYDDYDGVYFTIQSLRLYHPEVTAETEIVVLDNNPGGLCAKALADLANHIEGYRYIPNQTTRGTAVRDLIFRHARTPYVITVDSHVLFQPGAIQRLIDYFDDHPECGDLLQGPLVYDDLKKTSTHFQPEWSKGMYGRWGNDERAGDPDGEPFEVPMQGLGVFACRRDAWQGFNPRFRGFGGEEGYIHEKFRQAGHRAMCLPFLRWTHRFERPFGTQYPNKWEDRIWNYFVGWTELGLDTAPVEEHFCELLGPAVSEKIYRKVRQEFANPFFYFDAIYCINLERDKERWKAMQGRFERLGIAKKVRRFAAIETPESHHIGCALSHRAIVQEARTQQLQSVLIFEDDAIFSEPILDHLKKSVSELAARDWGLFYLGGHRWGQSFAQAPGCTSLDLVTGMLSCTHAVAYHHRVFQEVLENIPQQIDAARTWLKTHRGIDQYLAQLEKRYLASPVVASQGSILEQEDPAAKDQFF